MKKSENSELKLKFKELCSYLHYGDKVQIAREYKISITAVKYIIDCKFNNDKVFQALAEKSLLRMQEAKEKEVLINKIINS